MDVKKVQRIWFTGTTDANPEKLADPEVIVAFLEMVAGKLLKIENATAYALGMSPTLENIQGKKFFVGGIISKNASVLLDTVPDDQTAEVRIFADTLVHPDIQMKIILALRQTFEGE